MVVHVRLHERRASGDRDERGKCSFYTDSLHSIVSWITTFNPFLSCISTTKLLIWVVTNFVSKHVDSILDPRRINFMLH